MAVNITMRGSKLAQQELLLERVVREGRLYRTVTDDGSRAFKYLQSQADQGLTAATISAFIEAQEPDTSQSRH